MAGAKRGLEEKGVSEIPQSPEGRSFEQKKKAYHNALYRARRAEIGYAPKGTVDSNCLDQLRSMMPIPAVPHKMFVTGFFKDTESFVVTFGTPHLVNRQFDVDGMLAVDGTFNAFIGGFPLILVAEVRRNGFSKLKSISICSGENADCVGRAIVNTIGTTTQSFKFAVSDAGSAMVAAVRRTLPSCRHIICWYHMRTATGKKAQQLLNGSRGEGYNTGRLGADRPDYVALFMSHIDLLHCATCDSSFEAMFKLLDKYWREESNEEDIMTYMSTQWYSDCRYDFFSHDHIPNFCLF